MCMYYLAEVVFLAALICITLLVFHTHTSRSTFVGIFCDVFGIILYGAPLTVMIGNGVGAILAVAQLIFYACYYGSTPKEGKPVKDPVKPTASQVQMIVSAV
uniref:Uncharacterized protein n=2 Tax=Chenopodium quinoa TaxID=63459 RepID=A0A803KUK8_CHEQI